jgi:hypothetical protein
MLRQALAIVDGRCKNEVGPLEIMRCALFGAVHFASGRRQDQTPDRDASGCIRVIWGTSEDRSRHVFSKPARNTNKEELRHAENVEQQRKIARLTRGLVLMAAIQAIAAIVQSGAVKLPVLLNLCDLPECTTDQTGKTP